jgi:multiple sugar transport system substrate-binding protein
MGDADWIMGFTENGHRKEIGTFLDFVFTDRNVLDFADQNDLLPVTVSASEAMELDPAHKDLKAFLQELPGSVLPPVGKTSWAAVSESIKKNIGSVLGRIAREADAAEAAE